MCHLILALPLLGLGLFYVLPLAWAGPLYGAVLLVSAVFYVPIYRAHRQPVACGWEAMVGKLAEAVDGFPGLGRVKYHNVFWKARSKEPLAAGERAKIVGLQGMTLLVQRTAEPGAGGPREHRG